MRQKTYKIPHTTELNGLIESIGSLCVLQKEKKNFFNPKRDCGTGCSFTRYVYLKFSFEFFKMVFLL